MSSVDKFRERLSVAAELENLQRQSFEYFVHEVNPANGRVIDKTAPNWLASIAATGLLLAAYPVGIERKFMSRAGAVERVLATLRFFWSSPHGPEPDATGYKGFYYHFLDMQTSRAWQCELSTIDSTFIGKRMSCRMGRNAGDDNLRRTDYAAARFFVGAALTVEREEK